ncbi:MAG: hypothetical protein HUU21_07540 [Polyangiaceae bacterium]|nr:hypothetical protein [Polyangiaceae bacterium]
MPIFKFEAYMDDDFGSRKAVSRASEKLRTAADVLSSAEVRFALKSVRDAEAKDLTREILRIIAFTDDSISNPSIGSLFERAGGGPLNAMRANIATAYGVVESIAGTTGTTGLNVPAVMTLAGEGEAIAVARDCHVSVHSGICLSGARPVYIEPPFDRELGLLLPPTPGEVRAVLEANPDVRAIVVTLPTYHGLMGDITGIVAECRRRGVLVMVDEAHGPHFHFLRGLGFPLSAEDAGADLITQSTHKVLSALNQGSLLHFNRKELVTRYEEMQALGFQSTSFSYPILISIEHAVGQMVNDGERLWGQALKLAEELRRGASSLPGVRVVDERIVDGSRVVGLDPTRVTLNVRDAGLTGYEVGRRLLGEGILVEMATPDVVLFLVGIAEKREQIAATLGALARAFVGGAKARTAAAFEPPRSPEQVLTPRQAMMNTFRERLPKAEAIGRISAETIGCYPPGQAIFVAGERLTADGVRYLTQAVEAGGHLKRVQDDDFQTIEVVREMKGGSHE